MDADEFTNTVDAKLPTAPQLIGRELANYKIISLLGRGGMGEVYLAEDKRLHRKVALKLLPAQFTSDAERVRRFEREAAAASAINHPNILTIHEIGQSEQTHYLVPILLYIHLIFARGKSQCCPVLKGNILPAGHLTGAPLRPCHAISGNCFSMI